MLGLKLKPLANLVSSRRLSRATLRQVSAATRRPPFDPAALRTGILHLGCGNFHRAHQAVATQRAIAAEGRNGLHWGIASVSMMRPATPDRLRAQDGLYTLIERRESGLRAEIVGTLREVVHAPTDILGLPLRIAAPGTRIVTLTITASGYLLAPTTGRLQEDHPAILHDLENPGRPTTAIGALAAGLDLVRQAGGTPPTIISCDNVPSNGSTLRQAVLDFAALRDDALANWIAVNARFPNTMVDRIVPTTSEADLTDALRLTRLRDTAPVSAEPFMQWVIEDFDGPRPRWEAAGARFVTDVEPYEQAKLRLLNGTHMLLAYLGALANYRTIAETVADPVFHDLAQHFMLIEQGPTLDMPAQERGVYVEQLLERLANPAIRHDLARIGRNGSDKMAARLMQALRENLAAGREATASILTIAAWVRWFALRDTSGTTVRLNDPLQVDLREMCEDVGEDHMLQARTVLDLEDIFGPRLPGHGRVTRDLAVALRELHLHPVQEVVRRHLALAEG